MGCELLGVGTRRKDIKVSQPSPGRPHMKCRVAWNAAAVSWDCPCHGSRFTVEGDVIEGPACEPLMIKPFV